jgi:DNA replication protein DnaC
MGLEPINLVAHLEKLRQADEDRRRANPEAYEAELAAYEARRQQEAAQEVWQARAARLERSGADDQLPDDVKGLVLKGDLGDWHAVQATRGWLANRDGKSCLVLAGTTGVGKTVAAADALASEGGLLVSANEFVIAFSAMFGHEAEARERMLKARLLVIDDVGTEDDHGRMTSALVALLSKRASAQWSPTIMTTNMSVNEFAKRYDSDRLKSRCSQLMNWVQLKDKQDLRRRKREAKP